MGASNIYLLPKIKQRIDEAYIVFGVGKVKKKKFTSETIVGALLDLCVASVRFECDILNPTLHTNIILFSIFSLQIASS